MASSAATSAAPPATSGLRATLVTTGYVVTSIAALAILYWRFVATLACQACRDSSTHRRPSFASLVDHTVTIVSQGIVYFIAPPLFGRTVVNASLFLLLAWVYAPFVFAGVYWYVLVRLRQVDLLRVTLETAPLAVLLYTVLVAPVLFKVNIEDTGYAIMTALLEAAIFPVVIVILAVTFGQFFARWNLARAQDSLPGYSGIGMFLVVPDRHRWKRISSRVDLGYPGQRAGFHLPTLSSRPEFSSRRPHHGYAHFSVRASDRHHRARGEEHVARHLTADSGDTTFPGRAQITAL